MNVIIDLKGAKLKDLSNKQVSQTWFNGLGHSHIQVTFDRVLEVLSRTLRLSLYSEHSYVL